MGFRPKTAEIPIGADMYTRYAVNFADPDAGRRLGLIQALFELRNAGKLLPYEFDDVEEIRRWLEQNLARPSSLDGSAETHAPENAHSWFKDSATEHISRMQQLVEILESHDVPVEVITTNRPGFITYEDDHQIVAESIEDLQT